MLKLISQQDAHRLRDFFLEAGYADVRERLKLSELSSPRLRNIPRLMDSTEEPNPLNLLVRWFWIGVPQDASQDGKLIPPWVTALMLDCGFLRREGEQLIPQAMLIPIERALIWSDQTSRMDSGHSDVVLWPNPTSRLLSNFAIRRPSRLTLDLGSGNGIQTIAAAAHSEHVVATDLNPRAAEFGLFNLRLNGVENAEYLLGDTFEPVAGRTFDLILSNPPFFISPHDRYLFCDNPMELDGLVRHIARQAPAYLNEDGYFQMLCEWAQIAGQPWQERVVEWFKDSGCDVWIMKGHTQSPSDYAQDRVRDIGGAEKNDAALYESYMGYYRKHNVEAIHDGLIAMRRRSVKIGLRFRKCHTLPAFLSVIRSSRFSQRAIFCNPTPRTRKCFPQNRSCLPMRGWSRPFSPRTMAGICNRLT